MQVWAGMPSQARASGPQGRSQGPRHTRPKSGPPRTLGLSQAPQSGWVSSRTPRPRGSGQGWCPKEAAGREAAPLN